MSFRRCRFVAGLLREARQTMPASMVNGTQRVSSSDGLSQTVIDSVRGRVIA